MSGSPTQARSSEARSSEIVVRLAALARLFAENVAAATRDGARHVAAELELVGLSDRDKQRARQKAEARGLDGFLLTLDAPSYQVAMASLDDRTLRKTLYEAYYTRASDRGPRAGHHDNAPLLGEMLELRHELALSFGVRNYAELALRDGVFSEPDEVEHRLVSHHRGTKARAQLELDQLWAFAKEKGVPRGFSCWDLPYYSAWLMREQIGVTDAEIREYFALGDVLAAALTLGSVLLGVSIEPLSSAAGPHCERRAYRVADPDGPPFGLLELDAFALDDTAGEDRVVLREGLDEKLPVARVECGFEPPERGSSVRLTHSEVETLFRGVGRGLFLLVTRTPVRSELGVPQAAAGQLSHAAALGSEVAGSYFERFASDFDTLKTCARQRQTGLELSRELCHKLLQKRALHAGIAASQQLELALFDLRAHRDHVPLGKSTQLRVQVLDTFTQIRREQSVLPPSYWTRFANICTPIFVHDRAARLWESDWAREMGAALFACAEQSGFATAVKRRLRDTFWAAGEHTLKDRLEGALGRVPPFGTSLP